VAEPFWSWNREWNIQRLDAYVTPPGRPVFVLSWKGPAAISDAVTDDIVRSVDAIADGKRMPVDPPLDGSPIIRVLKFAAPPMRFEPAPCRSAPDAPSSLRVETNTGGFVALAWDAPAVRPDRYLLDVGNAPASPNAAPRELDRWPLFTTRDVPRGAYYVRVRAKNTCGVSGASNEIRVIVE